MFLRKYPRLLILLASAAMLNGCIKEDTSDCPSGLRLKFSFTLHENGGNKFGEEVNRVYVYMFDEQGILQVKATDNGKTLSYSYLQDNLVKAVTSPNPFGSLPDNYVMHLDIPAGRYNIIAWGDNGLNPESMFFDARMNPSATFEYQEGVAPGSASMEDFRMFIRHIPAPDIPEDIMPIVPEIDDQWYGAYGTRNKITSEYVREYIAVKSDGITEAAIELIKNTNILKVTITGLENLPAAENGSPSPLHMWVTGANSYSNTDNSTGQNAQSIRYIPYSEQMDASQILADIKIMRIDLKNNTARPMFLTIENPVTKQQYPGQPIDIVGTLMQARDTRGNYIYNNQSDFDREYEHSLEVRIDANLQVRIFVRGWEVITIHPEV